MPNRQDPEEDQGKASQRPTHYRSMVVIRLEREAFAKIFSASKLAGCPTASDWIRRVLSDAASREIQHYYDSHRGRF